MRGWSIISDLPTTLTSSIETDQKSKVITTQSDKTSRQFDLMRNAEKTKTFVIERNDKLRTLAIEQVELLHSSICSILSI